MNMIKEIVISVGRVSFYRDTQRYPRVYKLTDCSTDRFDECFNWGKGREGWKLKFIFVYPNDVVVSWRRIKNG